MIITDKNRKYYLIGVITFSVLLTSFSYYFYQAFYTPNALVEEESTAYLKIPRGASFRQVSDSLYHNGIVNDMVTFSLVAKLMDYQENVKPGRYEIQPRMTNMQLVRALRSGRQTPLNITFNNIRTKEDLADRITRNLEIDADAFYSLLTDSAYVKKFGFSEESIMGMFIPNTYEVYWNTPATELFDRMYKEYQRFWTDHRKARAEALGMDPKQVSVLASIVQAETIKADERPKVAGVYINRLKINMPLQADPTLVFALGDFSIKRVLNVHKEIDSPYNTYKYPGLPPGPINLPEISALDAVLNYQDHNYLYFCAKDDFSGYHAFATNLRDHMINARRYSNALNAAGIYK
ncbi:MAG TPA: endolytic transglycosylase MltG [Cyclobacteriaceae bacterium]|nr:endolytic transglycosylase MltG [Cyclobacteriaceae bacterium]